LKSLAQGELLQQKHPLNPDKPNKQKAPGIKTKNNKREGTKKSANNKAIYNPLQITKLQ